MEIQDYAQNQSFQLVTWQESLANEDPLALRGVNIEGGCYICGHDQQTICHLFFRCPYTIMTFLKLYLCVLFLVLKTILGLILSTSGQGTPVQLSQKISQWCGTKFGMLEKHHGPARKYHHLLKQEGMQLKYLIPTVKNWFLLVWCTEYRKTIQTRLDTSRRLL